jgi:hypothetical protein
VAASGRVLRDARGLRQGEGLLRAKDVVRRPLRDDEELPRFDLVLVLDHGVLRDAEADEGPEERARSAADGRPLEAADDAADERTEDDDVPDDRDQEKRRREEDADEPSPEGSRLPPEPDAIARVVVAECVLFRPEVLSDDRQLFHVEAGLLERLDRFVCLVVRAVHRDCCACLGHE